MRSPLALAAALLLVAAPLAACGDDDEPAADAPTEGTSAPAEDEPAGEAATTTVAIGDFVFDPTPVEVAVGDSVVWENTHSQAHTATGNGDLDWNTGNVAPGDTSEPVTFDEPGTYTYICALHPFMEGTVEVSA